MSGWISRYFRLEALQTTFRREVLAGVTTFATVAYVIVVNPKVLEAAGIPFGPSMVATILTAFFGTMALGIYARRPFAILPYMGENAFIAYTVVQVLGYTWQTALGAVFIGGVLFTLISAFRIRSWLANAIPNSLKIAFSVGIGLYLTFIGLNHTGIVELGVEGAPVHVGDLTSLPIFLAVVCFFVMAFLMIHRFKGALLIGILSMSVVAFVTGVAAFPTQLVSMPPSLKPIFLELDIAGALHWGFFSVILTVLVMDFVDTTGTLMGLSYKAGLLDEQGNLPEIEKPMLCDSTATVVGALLGTSTAGIYLESAAGIEAGGRSGLTAVVTALLFLLALFFSPLLTAIPACAYGPALMIVGLLMLGPVTRLEYHDLTEALPAFCAIVMMSFSFNLGVGITAGFVTYPLAKIFAGRAREVALGMWILAALSLLFYVFYPY